MERLIELLPNELNEKKEQNATDQTKSKNDELWTKEVSYASLRKALEILEMQGPVEFMTTDRQLMMILRLLTQSTPNDRRGASDTATLTWAELVQCYKTCIIGMTTLQHLSRQDDTRQRTRDRTLAMLALFEPQSRLWSSPLTPVRALANTSALNSTARSSFAPTRAVRRRKTYRVWLTGAFVASIVAAGIYVYMEPTPTFYAASKGDQRKAHTSTKNGPTFSAKSRVPTTRSKMFSSTSRFSASASVYVDDEEDDDGATGVAGPAVLVAGVGTPVAAYAARAVLLHIGRGAAFVAKVAPVAAFGKWMVMGVGGISLASLILRSLRALGQGLTGNDHDYYDE